MHMHAGMNLCLCVCILVSRWLVLTLTKTKQMWLFKQIQCMSSVMRIWGPACTWVCVWGTRECRFVVFRLHVLQGRILWRRKRWTMSRPLLCLFTHKQQAREQASVSQQNHLHSSERMEISFWFWFQKGFLKNTSVQRSSLSKEDLWISFDGCLCSLFPAI